VIVRDIRKKGGNIGYDAGSMAMEDLVESRLIGLCGSRRRPRPAMAAKRAAVAKRRRKLPRDGTHIEAGETGSDRGIRAGQEPKTDRVMEE
jgi:hypothetical protein